MFLQSDGTAVAECEPGHGMPCPYGDTRPSRGVTYRAVPRCARLFAGSLLLVWPADRRRDDLPLLPAL